MNNYLYLKERTYEIIEKAKDGDKYSKYFDIIILFTIVLNSIAIVLESFSDLYSTFFYMFRILEVVSVIIFSIEYLLRVWTSDIRFPSSKGRIFSLLKYMVSFMAVIDLFAILPFYLPMFIPVDLRFLRMLRISRLLRILKVNRYTKALGLITEVIKDKKDELIATIFIMGIMIMASSTLMYYFETEIQPEAFPNIVAAFWWAIATLTTVGYGDIYPITAIGKLLASVIALLGIGLVALPTGIISSGFIQGITKKEIVTICPHCGENIKDVKEK